LDYFEHESAITYRFKERVISGKSLLFSEGYLEFETPEFVDFTSVTVGERILKHISDPLGKTDKKYFNPKLCSLIKPETIETTPLFFNPKTKISIDEVLHLTSAAYATVMKRFTDQGLHPGLTMLFYGTPGTGKTELVKQLAKINNRTILIVDAASIRSKWVGESEKNIRRIFLEYKVATAVFGETPILLFNESDALMGKRNDVQSSVDQMNNAMQNMLLQELEDFKGIFIATTNLIDNLDKAFDRRILYKLNFDQPDETTRFDILSSQFPMFEAKTITEISKMYTLSGGQIQNLKKKFLVEQILFNGEDLNEEKFKLYIEEEISFRKSTKSKIGFSNS
jgi:hypothetical protein